MTEIKACPFCGIFPLPNTMTENEISDQPNMTPWTPRLKRLLACARQNAVVAGHAYVGCEHVFAAIAEMCISDPNFNAQFVLSPIASETAKRAAALSKLTTEEQKLLKLV